MNGISEFIVRAGVVVEYVVVVGKADVVVLLVESTLTSVVVAMIVVVVAKLVDVDDVNVLSRYVVGSVYEVDAVVVTWASIFWE